MSKNSNKTEKNKKISSASKSSSSKIEVPSIDVSNNPSTTSQ